MRPLRSAILSTILLVNMAQASEAPARVKWMDKMFYTVNRNVDLQAPIWVNTEAERNSYGTEYMKSLITSAHKIAKKYLEYGDHEAYNAFMMLSLTFPLHEGLYMSFRETKDEKGLCYEPANSGDIMFQQTKKKIFENVQVNLESEFASEEEKRQLEILKESDIENFEKLRNILVDDYTHIKLQEKKESIANTESPSNYRHFKKYLKGGENPFIVECSDVKEDQIIRQIIRGGDGTDIGPVQLSLRWHFDNFIGKKYYESIDKTFDYGLNFIHAGFKKLYYDSTNSKKAMSCVMTGGKVDLNKLIRATWSGKYNQGQVSKSCRIDDINKLAELEKESSKLTRKIRFVSSRSKKQKYQEKVTQLENEIKMIKRHPDFHFKNNLEKVNGFLDKKSVGYTDSISFETSKEVKDAIDEIINNFNEGNADGKTHSKVQAILKS
ncbi:hypothetical protein [Bacteriovorax sp. Seq25_V]|uniref:hypothetical protein n=1 Tax=Bacteriovorax sp. Seq25_V TaxID=1201288 RepID=UPI00038A41CB|nr:hypothetical protein [Bacteriovorax sp. Seq25_V]EQC46630.1 hypothetical protein M900_2367 [Bacteriovorax sp. Seq25_V]